MTNTDWPQFVRAARTVCSTLHYIMHVHVLASVAARMTLQGLSLLDKVLNEWYLELEH